MLGGAAPPGNSRVDPGRQMSIVVVHRWVSLLVVRRFWCYMGDASTTRVGATAKPKINFGNSREGECGTGFHGVWSVVHVKGALFLHHFQCTILLAVVLWDNVNTPQASKPKRRLDARDSH
jgi:hypothetical protein